MTGSTTKTSSRLRRTAAAAVAACGAGLSLIAAAPAPQAPQAPQAADTTRVYVWGTDVNMRGCAEFSCPPYSGIKVSRMYVTAYCVDAGGPRGWISAVYVRGGGNYDPIPGVSQNFEDCF